MSAPTVRQPGRRPAHPRGPGDRALRRAWWSLALYPVSFVLAFLVGEGLYALLVAEGSDPAPGEVLLAGAPALLVFVAPGVAAYAFGRRAMRAGRRDALAPLVIGAAVGIGFVALNLLSFAVQAVLG